MHEIAIKNGGQCLSSEYVNSSTKLQWECSIGHKWAASATSIRQGSWCPKCGGTSKLSIQDMLKVAVERKGKCLSKIYVGVHSKLRWKCKVKEHPSWMASANNIRRGGWCPKCRLGKRLK